MSLGNPPQAEPQVHILGLGNLGRLYAHALATLPAPPSVVLLFNRPTLTSEWETAGRQISITTNGNVSSSSNYQTQLIDAAPAAPIDILIIATKTLHTLEALSAIKTRLGANSTILFTQNGMDVVAEVNQALFPRKETRPQYLAAITSHGVYSLSPFKSVHAGLADATIGPIILDPDTSTQLTSQSRYLIDKIIAASSLAAREVTGEELLLLRLQKLAINTMLNPLTSIFNCKNGELFTREPILGLMRLLLTETSQVLQRISPGPEISSPFSFKNLEKLILDVAKRTGQNNSSMLQDVRAGRETEIDYINGYIVKKGKEFGIDVRWNEKLVEMAKERKVIGVDEIEKFFKP